MQVKATFVTLHGAMSLLGSLWAKRRYECLCHILWVNMLCGVAEFQFFRNWNVSFFMGKNSFNCFLSAISQGIIVHFLFVFPCNAGGYEDFSYDLRSLRIQP